MNARVKAKLSIAFLSVALMTLLMPVFAFADPIDDHAIDFSTESNVPGEELYFDSPSTAIVSPEGALLETAISETASPAENPDGGPDLSATEKTESHDLDEVSSDADETTLPSLDGQEEVGNVSGYEPDAENQTEIVTQDEAGYCGNGVVWIFTDDGTLTISSDGSGDGVIEASAGQTSLSSISSAVQSIVIEQGIITIGDSAFQGFNALKYVSIAGSVSSIGYQSFAFCTQLSAVDFMGTSSLQSIGQAAFTNTAISSICIPDSVTNISEEAFLSCNELNAVQFGTSHSSINSIAMNAFDSEGNPFATVKFYGTESEWNAINISEIGNERLKNALIQFSLPSYQITLNPNGGSFGGAPGAILYTNENGVLGESTVLPTPTYDNHSFDGWFDDQFNGEQITLNTPFNGDTTIWAHWTENVPEPVSYTVVFDATDGEFDGSGKTMTIGTNTNGILDQQPATPKYSAHAFDGWYTAAEGGEKVDTTKAITGNDTFYAHWISFSDAQFHTISFEPNSGVFSDGSYDVKKVMTDAHGRVTNAPIASHENYKFLGWFYSTSGGQPIDFDTVEFTKNTSVYAQWQQDYNAPVEYTVTFFLNDGVNTAAYVTLTTSTIGGYHQLNTLPERPTRNGWIFREWTDAASGGNSVDLSTMFYVDSNAYAQWDPDTSQPRYFTITLDANGGTLTCDASLVTDGTGKLAEPSAPIREGFRFVAWQDLFNNPVDFSVSFTSNEYLIAKWEEDDPVVTPTGPFTVTFDADGGVLSSEAYFTTDDNGKLAAVAPAPTKDGYDFAGWYTAAGTSGDRVSTSTTFTSDTTVYAHWTASTGASDDPNTPGDDPNTPGDDPNTPGDDPNIPGDDPNTPGDDPNTPGDDPNIPDVPSVPSYTVIEGANGNWIAGNDEDLVIRADGAFADFDHIKIDGVRLDEKHFDVREGSTIVSLKNAYLSSLNEGTHEIRFVYKDGGEAQTNFSVQMRPAVYVPSDNGSPLTQVDSAAAGSEGSDSQVPRTGDTEPMSVFAYILLAGFACIAGAKSRRRRVQ